MSVAYESSTPNLDVTAVTSDLGVACELPT